MVEENLMQFYRDSDRRSDDIIILYLSGHGGVTNDRFGLIASDTTASNIAYTSIKMSTITRILFNTVKNVSSLVIIDSSKAGFAARELSEELNTFSSSRTISGILASTGPLNDAAESGFWPALKLAIQEWLDTTDEPLLTPSQLLNSINRIMSNPVHRKSLIGHEQNAELHSINLRNLAQIPYFARPSDIYARARQPNVVQSRISLGLMSGRRELLELAEFCTSADPNLSYLLVQGAPGSGKSALLDAFVLEPPPDTRVVSFFIAHQVAGDNDTQHAFAGAVIEQLTAMLGNKLMPHWVANSPITTRFSYLLERVAVMCQQADERLILVVDGLASIFREVAVPC